MLPGYAEPYANSSLIAEVYANLGWLGMPLLKPTPIWDTPGRGRVPEIAEIAIIG
jgi:hypothetical protein